MSFEIKPTLVTKTPSGFWYGTLFVGALLGLFGISLYFSPEVRNALASWLSPPTKVVEKVRGLPVFVPLRTQPVSMNDLVCMSILRLDNPDSGIEIFTENEVGLPVAYDSRHPTSNYSVPPEISRQQGDKVYVPRDYLLSARKVRVCQGDKNAPSVVLNQEDLRRFLSQPAGECSPPDKVQPLCLLGSRECRAWVKLRKS